MRPLILSVLLATLAPAQSIAQTIPTMPRTTYPEPGIFCGMFTLCPKVAKTPTDG